MIMQHVRLKRLIVAAFIPVGALLFFSGPTDGQPATTRAAKPQTSKTRPDSHERFDYLVRGDFFAGMAGNQARFDKAMKVCEDALAKNPDHAEALVWHGGGLIWRAGQAFQMRAENLALQESSKQSKQSTSCLFVGH